MTNLKRTAPAPMAECALVCPPKSSPLVRFKTGMRYETQMSERGRVEKKLRATLPARDRTLASSADHKSAAAELLLAQDALRQSQDRLNAIIESASDAIVTVDAGQKVVMFNAAAQRMFGCPAQEAMGQALERFIPERLRAQEAAHHRVFSEAGIIGRAAGAPDSLWAVRASGEEFQIEASISQAESGGKKLFTIILREVTERKRAEEARERLAEELSRQTEELIRSQQALQVQTSLLQSVLDNIGEGLVAANEHGEFVLWNAAAEKIVGMGAANVPSEEWTAHYGLFLPDTETPFPIDQNPLARAIRGEASTSEMFVRNPGLKEAVWIEANAHPLSDADGTPRGGVVAFRDITLKKKAEQEIHKLNEELEYRVVERTAQLEAANRELEAFTYSVSHDLRAPLRHISGFTRILSEDFGPALPVEAQKHLQRIEQGAHRMGQLVDELLNLARVGRQALSRQTTALNLIVSDVVALLEPEIGDRKVEWRIADLPSAECDPVLVRQVFQNLIANALKYSRPRSPAIIEIGRTQQNGQPAVFVRDNGVGFSMKYADKLFGVFQRLHRAEEFEGTGVGLATAHRIIQKHGGRIWAEAELHQGATFYFTLGGLESAESRSKTEAAGP